MDLFAEAFAEVRRHLMTARTRRTITCIPNPMAFADQYHNLWERL